MPSIVAAIASATMVACAHGVPAIPSQGGPAWTELTTEHFIMWTDASVARGKELVRDMERHRQIVLGVAFNEVRVTQRSFVIALRDADEVAAFVPAQFVAYAWSGNPSRLPTIVLAADTEGDQAHTITHELTHVISFGVVPDQPHWFAEGLAGYFETARIDAERGTVEVGEPLPYIKAQLRTTHPTPIAEVFACEHHGCMDSMFYTTTWALFSYLRNEHPQQLLRYLQRLADTPKAAHATAWHDAVPELPPELLDRELMRWLAYGKHAVAHYNAKFQDWPVTTRVLGDGDALAARTLVRYGFAPDAPDTKAELARALATDRTNVLAQLIAAMANKAIAPADATAVAAAHPDDWRAWWLVGFAFQRGPEAMQAHDRMCALVGTDPNVGLPAGWCAPVTKRPAE